MSLRRLLLAIALLTLVVGAVVGLAGSSALSAARALERARADLTAVSASDSDVEQARAVLRRAEQELLRAQRELDTWPVDVVTQVPVLGRSLRVERAVARSAMHVVEGASVLAERLPAVQAQGGGVDLAALAAIEHDVASSARGARQALSDLRTTETDLTPRKVRDARRDALAALEPVVTALDRASAGLHLVSGLLGARGDRSVLVMLQNNAELRGTGGYAATFATGRTSAGRLVLDPLRDVVAFADPAERARRVPAPAEYAMDYGPLSGDTTVWRSWNMSPHVPDSAVVGARVAGAVLGHEPDVLVLVDVPAMARLAQLGDGVVMPDGSTLSPDELSRALLVDAYEDAGEEREAQDRRRVQLQAAATSTFTGLLSGQLPVADVARALADLVAGRHLTAWSARPDEQATLEALGAAGAVQAPPGSDLSHVSVNNLGGNKLDIYVDRTVSVEAVVSPTEAQVVQRVVFRNTAPDDLVRYVAGPHSPGTVFSRVELSLPADAEDVAAVQDGRPWPGRVDAGSARLRLPTRVDIPRGGTSTLEVRYRLPLSDGEYDLRLIPQPLVQDATLSLAVRAVEGYRLVGDDVRDGVLLQEGAFDETQDVSVDLVEAG